MSVVVVGGGQAAGQFTASLRQLGFQDQITIVCAENHLPYQRPPLSKQYLTGEVTQENVTLRPEKFYASKDIVVKSGTRVDEIDLKNQIVHGDDGCEFAYSQLVLATGSKPVPLSVPGANAENVFLFRTIDDVNAIRAQLETPRNVVIVGGGYIGLEVAASCKSQGHQVTVIELEDRLLKRVAPTQISEYFQRVHQSRGINLQLGKLVEEILTDTSGKVEGVRCNDSVEIPADVVIVGIGIGPSTELAANHNLKTENGIVVDEYCRTQSSNIYAIGDCTNHPNALLDRRLRLESVPNAMEQSRVAAMNITGTPRAYATYPWFWSDQFDLKLQMVGLLDEYDEMVVRGEMTEDQFTAFYLYKGKLQCANSVNSPREFLAAKQLVGQPVEAKALQNPDVDLKELINRDKG